MFESFCGLVGLCILMLAYIVHLRGRPTYYEGRLDGYKACESLAHYRMVRRGDAQDKIEEILA